MEPENKHETKINVNACENGKAISFLSNLVRSQMIKSVRAENYMVKLKAMVKVKAKVNVKVKLKVKVNSSLCFFLTDYYF
jgi:hypothetical protein